MRRMSRGEVTSESVYESGNGDGTQTGNGTGDWNGNVTRSPGCYYYWGEVAPQ
jgi:hypothetical protein